MAQSEHIAQFLRGATHWRNWRTQNPDVRPDLSGYDFTQLRPIVWQDSSGNRHSTQLWHFDFTNCDLERVVLTGQDIQDTDFSGATLKFAMLNDTIFKNATARGADLRNANLKGARLIASDFSGADLSGASVFGVSPWGMTLTDAIQNDLLITPTNAEAAITVDDIAIAQFVYMLLTSHELRNPIDSITKRVALILGRFTPERKPTLERIRDTIRKHNYVPMLFDFEKPSTRNTMETVTLLARLARFVIADLTDAKSVLQELQEIVPSSPNLAVQTVVLSDQELPGMFDTFSSYRSFLTPFAYRDTPHLTAKIPALIAKAERLTQRMLTPPQPRRSRM